MKCDAHNQERIPVYTCPDCLREEQTAVRKAVKGYDELQKKNEIMQKYIDEIKSWEGADTEIQVAIDIINDMEEELRHLVC